MIKAVLFDVDGVLIDSFDANLKFYQTLLTKAGYKPPTRAMYTRMFQLPMVEVIKKVTNSDSEKEIQRIWEMGQTRSVEYPLHLLTLPGGAKETIKKLHKKYLLGIVTSRGRYGVFEFPELASLKEYFSAVTAYEDTVNHKPHPEPLLLTSKQLNVKPHEIVYVGDMDNDIQAAKAAGMKIIIFSSVQFQSADRNTSSFKEIPSLIESLHG